VSQVLEPSLTRIGESSYLFTWAVGFYNTIFSVGAEGVIALDPINREAAAAYRSAIASVTDKPIRFVVYSHEHLDHIVGAEVLAPDAEIVAHKDVPAALIGRGHVHVPLPTTLVDGFRPITSGDVTWELIDLGPNHSRTNLAVLNRKDRWVAMIDVLSGGMTPYRNLPLSDFHGFRQTLDRLATFDVDAVIDGHCPPAGLDWVDNYRRYFGDLLAATLAVREEVDERAVLAQLPDPTGTVEDGIALTELMFTRTAELVVERLRPDYGHWPAFDHWAPQNVDRALVYAITGE
jgi:glyoxylase-like metal-dependent hydrolase (beta-lactamase superfamily II)